MDGLGRTTKVTDPAGHVTYTVYDDADHEVRTYAGWNTATNAPTGPTVGDARGPGGQLHRDADHVGRAAPDGRRAGRDGGDRRRADPVAGRTPTRPGR